MAAHQAGAHGGPYLRIYTDRLEARHNRTGSRRLR